MGQNNILTTLEAHDNVRTMGEVIEWKKTVNKMSMREKREACIVFLEIIKYPQT